MKTVILSPHTDDAVFSIGAHLCSMDSPLVVAPMAGIPTDIAGRAKHQTLRAEHAVAMSIVSADHLNGPFLDDVYPPPDPHIFSAWVSVQLRDADVVYMPLGIHHHDHLLVSNAAIAFLLSNRQISVRFYAELPYRTRYAGLAAERLDFIRLLFGDLEAIPDETGHRRGKEAALRVYVSQTDERLISELLVPEQIWQLA